MLWYGVSVCSLHPIFQELTEICGFIVHFISQSLYPVEVSETVDVQVASSLWLLMILRSWALVQGVLLTSVVWSDLAPVSSSCLCGKHTAFASRFLVQK